MDIFFLANTIWSASKYILYAARVLFIRAVMVFTILIPDPVHFSILQRPELKKKLKCENMMIYDNRATLSVIALSLVK